MASGINGSIGIFDSGIGGLSLVESIHHELPNESIHYFADLKNLPYGEKTKEQVCEYSLVIAQHLKANGAKLIVIACSTASAVAANLLRAELEIPIVTVLNPFFQKEILNRTPNKKVGVVSTRLTHKSGMFQHWLQAANPNLEVHSLPASDLVDEISGGELATERMKELVQGSVASFIGKVDEIVLGCTHFNFVEDLFDEILPESVALSSAPIPTAKYVRHLLEECHALCKEGEGEVRVQASETDPIFEHFVTEHLEFVRS